MWGMLQIINYTMGNNSSLSNCARDETMAFRLAKGESFEFVPPKDAAVSLPNKILSILEYIYHTFRYYGEQLKKMIRKGELRNALLDFLVSQRWVSYCMSLSASSPYLMDLL
jgi:hypothetical protein